MTEFTPDPSTTPSRDQQYDRFVLLISRHDLSIRRFIRFLLPAADGVDDVVQETALECWKKFDQFEPANDNSESDEFIRWACVIARFKVLSWQRDHSRDRLVFRESVINALSRTSTDQFEQRESERHAIEHCLRKLPEDDRRLVLSIHSPGKSVASIAAETGQKARKLYSKVHRLRATLRNCVQHRIAAGVAHG